MSISRKYIALREAREQCLADETENTINSDSGMCPDVNGKRSVCFLGHGGEVTRHDEFLGFNRFPDEKLCKCILSCLEQYVVVIESITESNTFTSATYLTIERPK